MGKLRNLFLLFTMTVFTHGCTYLRGPASAYGNFYAAHLGSVRLPSIEDIRLYDQVAPGERLINQPVEKTWEACLNLALQSWGILRVEHDEGGGHRILLVSGEPMSYNPATAKLIDRWLAISIQPAGTHDSEINIAFVSPATLHVADPLESDFLPKGVKRRSQQHLSRRLAGIFRKQIAVVFDEDAHAERLKLADPTHPPRKILKPITTTESDIHNAAVLERRGNFRSASFRRGHVILDWPRLEQRLKEMTEQLSSVASWRLPEITVYIVADDTIGSFIEPNGDLFLTTGTLARAGDRDELAGLIAHELAHLDLKHHSTRTRRSLGASRSRGIMIGAGMIGGAILGGLYDSPGSPAPGDTLISLEEVAIGAAVGLGAMWAAAELSSSFGTSVGDSFIQRFSRIEELEADERATELLWAAGYDYRGLLRFLLKIQGSPESEIWVH